jgi:hypothetical protein
MTGSVVHVAAWSLSGAAFWLAYAGRLEPPLLNLRTARHLFG